MTDSGLAEECKDDSPLKWCGAFRDINVLTESNPMEELREGRQSRLKVCSSIDGKTPQKGKLIDFPV